MKIRLLVAASLLLAVGCQFQGPSGGESNYCYRIEWDRWMGNDALLLTNIEPVWEGSDLVLEDVWLAFRQQLNTSALRFDTYADRFVLQAAVSRHITVERQGDCWSGPAQS